MLVVWLTGWQEEGDLTSRLRVYRSVDSLVEFYIPLHQQTANGTLNKQPAEGFVYRDSYYEIVRQEVKNDTLLILGYANKKGSFWQQDLLDFVKHQFGNDTNTIPKKAHHLLKILLKEYYQGARLVISFCPLYWREPVVIPDLNSTLLTLPLPVYSPPPES